MPNLDPKAIAAEAKRRALENAGIPAPTPAPAAAASTPAPIAAPGDPIASLAAALRPHLIGSIQNDLNAALQSLNGDKLAALVDAAVAKYIPAPTVVTVQPADGGQPVDLGIAHRNMPILIERVRRQAYFPQGAYLVGPPGSAKTHAAIQVGQALGLRTIIQAIGRQTSKAELIGYMGPHGYVTTALRDAYENGGVFLLDEADSNAALLVILNTLVSQDFYTFPDATVAKHADFRVLIAANTNGSGATADHPTREVLDRATLSRFVELPWGYDLEMEKALALAKAATVPTYDHAKHGELIMKWAARVAAFREAVVETTTRYVRSPRQVITGAIDLACGDDWHTVEATHIWQGVTREDRARIEASKAWKA